MSRLCLDGGVLGIVHEIACACGLQEFGGQTRRLAHVFGMSQRLLDEISRVAATHLNAARAEIARQQVLHEAWVVLQLAVPAEVLEDLREVGPGGAFAKDFVMDAAEKRLVHELRRLDIGCEHDQHHEWQVEFLPRLKCEEVDTALERNDPPIEQVPRRALLTAEVVDDEYAAIGECLNWRRVKAHRRRVRQIQRLQGQLSTYHHHRSAAAHPSGIASVPERQAGTDFRLNVKPLMVDRVIEFDDLALYFN